MPRENTGADPTEGGDLLESPRAARVALANELAGELRCARCSYDLRGLSIRAVCPECATPVRATLLLVVDPLADELQPIRMPRVVACSLVVWAFAALLGVLASSALRSEALLGAWVPRGAVWWLGWGVVASVIASGLGAAFSLISPHAGVRRPVSAAAVAGVVMYLPLTLVTHHAVLGRGHDPLAVATAMVILAVIIVLLRPMARILQARSFLMRTGQVDRQTLRVLAIVVLIASLGEVAQWATAESTWGDLVRPIAALVTAAAWTLFCVGLAGVAADCWRIRGVILQPPLSLAKLLGNEARTGA
jgi:hypothetical protein